LRGDEGAPDVDGYIIIEVVEGKVERIIRWAEVPSAGYTDVSGLR
jgi:hypothetical protein